MNEKGAAMQSEDVEEAANTALDDNTTTTTMTFTDNQESISPKNQAQLITSDIDSNTKFFYQNFDDDIEKVEVSSNESTDFDENDDDQSMIEHKQNESIKTWLQKISDLQKRLQIEPTNSSQNIHNTLSPPSSSSLQQPPPPPPPQQQQRVVKYQDLPYMGEMTLDNSKPRRGRKPKKADICHLIYKNYGTIFPGTPNPKNYLTTPTTTTTTNCKKIDNKEQDKSDVQNRIISSLLEKRLTQEINNKKTTTNSNLTISSNKTNQNEPLNLCIRDLNHLKIRFMKKSETEVIKTEPQSDDDVELIESPTDLKTPSRFPINSPEILATNPENGVAPGGYVYWPNAGVFIHPMALQQHLMHYQRMTVNNNYTLSNHSPRPPPEQPPTPPQQQQELRKLVPKVNRSKKQEINDETEFVINETKIKRNIDNNQKLTTPTPPTKRKRSAIFIPPIQTDNTTNPATEVSICKFKFTGGAKPQLQEKKMLSVDSGGNFRYYSGTGDKSMRGYEFFPRETLQQQINNNQCSSSTGAFLQASGERIYTTTPPVATATTTTTLPQQQLDLTTIKPNCDFLLSSEIQPDTTIFRPHHQQQQQQQQQQNKKRKSRKSLQREKLEQTFKEKGFLIQTQQLESAEGATYCKFRQLRKFTRYLFRSWKDYLPGNVRELQENSGDKIDNNSDDNGLINGTISVENDDNLSRHSSEFSNVQ